jgi:NAD(P)H-hydrate epimerase
VRSNEGSLYLAEQVREGEQQTAANLKLEMYQLMERAGKAVFGQLLQAYPQSKKILICCGGGNNGGDGYVVARLAREHGLDIELWQLGDHLQLKGDAATARDSWLATGGSISAPQEEVPADIEIIVDGLLGTGLKGDVREDYAAVINTINRAFCPVIAIDIPSGLCADTGANLGAVTRAEHTVSFIALKRGLFTGQAAEFVGQVRFAGLEVDSEFRRIVPANCRLISSDAVQAMLPARSRVAHKGSNGRILCLGGDRGMFGAIRLTAEACARIGGGLTRVVTQPENVSAIVSARPELMTYDWRGNSNEINDHLFWTDVIAIGPGLGSSSWGRSLVGYSRTVEKPVVADADGLNLLAKTPDHNPLRVITPHPGEAARLLGIDVQEVEADRFGAALKMQRKFGGVAVLKGAGTIIYDGDQYYICDAGNPGMASGGMGDVLTGLIAGLIGQGLSLSQAAQAGVWLHSSAADRCAAEHGERGMLASDLFPYIRRLANQMEL